MKERGEFAGDDGIKILNLEKDRERIVDLVRAVKLSPDYVDSADVWFGYTIGGKLVSCMALERRGELVHIQSLSTDKEYRRRGLAKALVDKAYDEYLGSGDTLVALTLFWNIGVYEKMGFHKVDAPEMKKRDDVAGRTKHKYCVAMVKNK